MARYDWPAPPRSRDDPGGRSRHRTRFRPAADPVADAPAPAPRRAEHASIMPTGNTDLWFPIGPSVMTRGQATGDPNVAGRIREICIEPVEGRRVYAASAGGGVWFSPDRGASWSPIDDFQVSPSIANVVNVASALSCGALNVRFAGPADDGPGDEIWVGTGEQFLYGGGRAGWSAGGEPSGEVAGIGLLHRTPGSPPTWTLEKGAPGAADSLLGKRVHRIVADPAETRQLVAATSNGLYVLPVGGAWTLVGSFPAAVGAPLDVLLEHQVAGTLRIWVAVASGLQVAEFSGAPGTAITPATLTFNPVALPTVNTNAAPAIGGTRVALALGGGTLYVLGRRAKTGKETRPYAQLWTVDASTTPLPTSATAISGIPLELFGHDNDQSDYDMAIAASPSVAGRIFVGGSGLTTEGEWNAAIYSCDVGAATATNVTYVGAGVHADVHVLRLGPAPPGDATKRTLWVGCDGGLFRSDADGGHGTFTDANDGLAVTQPGYVATHPTNPGIVVAGFQDNGTAIRTGDALWEQTFRGDGGGVVFDPGRDLRYLRQYTQVSWESSDHGAVRPVERRQAHALPHMETSEKFEKDSSNFYSGADALAAGGDTHLVFGSDRVWYSRNWGRSWVTLPTATDPRGGDNPNVQQDVLAPTGAAGHYGEATGSTDCCSTEGVGIHGAGIVTVKLSAPPPKPNGDLELRVLALLNDRLTWLIGTRLHTVASGAYTWNLAPVTDAIRPARPTEVADVTAGHPLAFLPAPNAVSDVAVHDASVGNVGSCYATTIGGFTAGSRLDTLWFRDGAGTWYPTGLRNTTTAPALGVVVDPVDPSIVYVGTSVGVVKGTLTTGGTPAAPTYTWAFAMLVNGLPEAAVQDLSIRVYGSAKLLRAALQARGVWEIDLNAGTTNPLTFLRVSRSDTRRLLPSATSGPQVAGDSVAGYDDSPDIVVDATGRTWTEPPSEAALSKLPSPGRATSLARVSLSQRHPQVHVLVHHRWRDAAAPATVRVALMRRALTGGGSAPPVAGLWAALVAAATSGTPPASLPDGWRPAAATLWQSPGGAVEPRLPRAVTFTLDLSADADDTALLLLAVVMSDANQITAGELPGAAATADQLVLASPHVAAKSVVLT